MWENFRKKVHRHFQRILKSHKSPDAIAWGVAIGTFISVMIPINWITILLGLFIILFFENLSKIALFLTLVLWNPFTLLPIYFVSFRIGNLILGDMGDLHASYIFQFWKISNLNYFLDFLQRFFLGNLITGGILAVLVFFLTRKIASVYQRQKEKKLRS